MLARRRSLPSAPLYPSLPTGPFTPASSSPAAPAPPSASRPSPPSKTPLFRSADSDGDSDDDASPAPRGAVAPESESESDEDTFAEATQGLGGEAVNEKNGSDSGDDSADELAAQLMSKATLSPSSPSRTSAAAATSSSQSKRKGKAPVPVDEPLPAAAPAPRALAPPPAATTSPDTPVISVPASLHLYDKSTGLFMQQSPSVRAGLYKLPAGEGHWLVVESAEEGREGEVWVSQGVSKETTVNFAEKERSMVFNYSTTSPPEEGGETQTFTWLLRLADVDAFERLQVAVSAALFEDKHGMGSWGKLKEDEREYGRKAWLEEDVEMWEGGEEQGSGSEEGDESAGESESESEEERVGSEGDSEEDDSGAFRFPFLSFPSLPLFLPPRLLHSLLLLTFPPSPSLADDERAISTSRRAFTSTSSSTKKKSPALKIGEKKRAKNSALAVGYKDDLSFVVQGDMIGVFKQQREGGKKVRRTFPFFFLPFRQSRMTSCRDSKLIARPFRL